MFKNILVAVDGSDHSLKAARLAGDLARLTNASLYLVTAFDPIPSFLGEPDRQRVISAHLKAAEQAVAKGRHEIGEISGKLDQEVIEGPAAEAIIRIAKTRSPDLIVMGTRGLGQLSGWVLGSQSQKVVSHAPCPVLLAR